MQIIPLNYHFEHLAGKRATLSGWGKTEKEKSPSFLSQTSMLIAFDKIDRGRPLLEMLNANPEFTGVCKGDSGGNFSFNIQYSFPL